MQNTASEEKTQTLCLQFQRWLLVYHSQAEIEDNEKILSSVNKGGPMSSRVVGVQMKAFMMWDATQAYFL